MTNATQYFIKNNYQNPEDARRDFRVGKTYIDGLDVLRTKIVARWYRVRSEHVFHTIGQDGYLPRADDSQEHTPFRWPQMAGLAASVTFRHLTAKVRRKVRRLPMHAKENCET